MKDRITHLLECWFLSEPPLFQVVSHHSIEANSQMPCAVRSGRRKIEYNPDYVKEMSDEALEQAMRTEAIRILLKHPYQRRPEACSQQAVAIGSNITIGDNYEMAHLNIDRPKDYDLPGKKTYEWYARRIQEMLPASGNGPEDAQGNRLSQSAARDAAISELWEEDELALIMIDEIIESTQNWGSLSGRFAERIKASLKARINWRNVLSGFRASILSSKRKLTRMRPNRRTGFENMGSIRRFDTRLLVAVDVSGSISSGDLSHFFGVINSAFRYGFTAVDLIQFDAGIKTVQSLRKVMRDVTAVGRGGTSFQEPVEYAHECGYDGLVILTDGYAPEPVLPEGMRCKIVWVCRDQASYDQGHRWMEKSGRVCIMELN